MCIRDRSYIFLRYCPPTSNIAAVSCPSEQYLHASISTANPCLLYTSDAADERSSVDLGGRRIIKKKKNDEDPPTGILDIITEKCVDYASYNPNYRLTSSTT